MLWTIIIVGVAHIVGVAIGYIFGASAVKNSYMELLEEGYIVLNHSKIEQDKKDLEDIKENKKNKKGKM